ncbi:ribokinase [Leifsonia shinshuensis]|uniref:Ribokinase n=1 Tax=Leifsonia shinshuensis TaxID=150026 RepID=A0A7G6YAL4_9MICO|nr:ribokinase [Leifsonia shinshuensis]QNE35529.1 ribokinase [Leifsonia shinshuensis]
MTVIVVGSINRDIRLDVVALPRPGETSTASATASGLGGKGANQAVAAAAAGAATVFVGAVGPDGDDLLAELAALGVDVAGAIRAPGTPTGTAIVLVDDAGENSIVISPGANASGSRERIEATLAASGPDDVLVLQNEIPAALGRHAAALARRAGVRVLWNAAPAPRSRAELIDDVDLLIVNETELHDIAQLLGAPTTSAAGASVSDTASAVAAALGCAIVCTLGARGALWIDGDTRGEVGAPRVDAVDTTGAGDTVVGYLAAGLAMSAAVSLETATARAAAAGAITVTRRGAAAAVPRRHEVDAILAGAPTGRTTS